MSYDLQHLNTRQPHLQKNRGAENKRVLSAIELYRR